MAAIALLIVAGASEYGAIIVCGRSTAREEARLHRLILQHCFALGPGYFGKRQTGHAVSMLTDGVERVAEYRQGFVGPMIGATLGSVAILVSVAIAIDPFSAGVLAIGIPFIPLAIGGFQRAFRRVSSASRAARTALAGEFLTAIQGLTTLVLLRAADRAGDRLAAAGEANRRATMSLLARNQLILLVAILSTFSNVAAHGIPRFDFNVVQFRQIVRLKSSQKFDRRGHSGRRFD